METARPRCGLAMVVVGLAAASIVAIGAKPQTAEAETLYEGSVETTASLALNPRGDFTLAWGASDHDWFRSKQPVRVRTGNVHSEQANQSELRVDESAGFADVSIGENGPAALSWKSWNGSVKSLLTVFASPDVPDQVEPGAGPVVIADDGRMFTLSRSRRTISLATREPGSFFGRSTRLASLVGTGKIGVARLYVDDSNRPIVVWSRASRDCTVGTPGSTAAASAKCKKQSAELFLTRLDAAGTALPTQAIGRSCSDGSVLTSTSSTTHVLADCAEGLRLIRARIDRSPVLKDRLHLNPSRRTSTSAVYLAGNRFAVAVEQTRDNGRGDFQWRMVYAGGSIASGFSPLAALSRYKPVSGRHAQIGNPSLLSTATGPAIWWYDNDGLKIARVRANRISSTIHLAKRGSRDAVVGVAGDGFGIAAWTIHAPGRGVRVEMRKFALK